MPTQHVSVGTHGVLWQTNLCCAFGLVLTQGVLWVNEPSLFHRESVRTHCVYEQTPLPTHESCVHKHTWYFENLQIVTSVFKNKSWQTWRRCSGVICQQSSSCKWLTMDKVRRQKPKVWVFWTLGVWQMLAVYTFCSAVELFSCCYCRICTSFAV